MIRRSARATQSMFSVPLSIEILAPDDSANHSTGMPRSSARSRAAIDPRALGLGDGAQRLGRVAEQRHPGHALGVARRRRVTRPATMPAVFCPGGRSTGTSRPASSRSCSTNVPARPGQQRGQLVRVDGPRAREPSTFSCTRPAGASARSAGRSLRMRDAGARPVGEAQRHARAAAAPGPPAAGPDSMIWSRPGADGQRRDDCGRTAASSDSGSSIDGHAYRKIRLCVQPPAEPPPRLRPPQAVQAGGQLPLDRREADDLARPSSSSGVTSRTSAIAMSRSSFGLLLRDDVEQVGVLGRGQPRRRRSSSAARGSAAGAVSGCMPADDPLLGEPVRRRAEGAPSRRRRPGCTRSPSTRRAGPSGASCRRAGSRSCARHLVGVAGPVRPGQVEVHEQRSRRSAPLGDRVSSAASAAGRSSTAPSAETRCSRVPAQLVVAGDDRCARRAGTTARSAGCGCGSSGGSATSSDRVRPVRSAAPSARRAAGSAARGWRPAPRPATRRSAARPGPRLSSASSRPARSSTSSRAAADHAAPRSSGSARRGRGRRPTG